jgi:hypothetical protein
MSILSMHRDASSQPFATLYRGTVGTVDTEQLANLCKMRGETWPAWPIGTKWFWQNFIILMCDIKFWRDNENLRSVYKQTFLKILSGFFHSSLIISETAFYKHVLEFYRPSKFLCQTSGRQYHWSLLTNYVPFFSPSLKGCVIEKQNYYIFMAVL